MIAGGNVVLTHEKGTGRESAAADLVSMTGGAVTGDGGGVGHVTGGGAGHVTRGEGADQEIGGDEGKGD